MTAGSVLARYRYDSARGPFAGVAGCCPAVGSRLRLGWPRLRVCRHRGRQRLGRLHLSHRRCGHQSLRGGRPPVGWLAAGEWLAYTVDVARAGTYTVQVRVGSPLPGRTFHIELDGVDVTGPIAVPEVAGWDRYETVELAGLPLSAGVQVLRVVDGAADFMDLQWIAVTAPGGTDPRRSARSRRRRRGAERHSGPRVGMPSACSRRRADAISRQRRGMRLSIRKGWQPRKAADIVGYTSSPPAPRHPSPLRHHAFAWAFPVRQEEQSMTSLPCLGHRGFGADGHSPAAGSPAATRRIDDPLLRHHHPDDRQSSDRAGEPAAPAVPGVSVVWAGDVRGRESVRLRVSQRRRSSGAARSSQRRQFLRHDRARRRMRPRHGLQGRWAGTLRTLHSFTGGASGGEYPCGVIQARGRQLLRHDLGGGASAARYSSWTGPGTLTTLHSFTGGSDGALPRGVIQATDGSFYGTTIGRRVERGTVFKLDGAGTLTTLHQLYRRRRRDPLTRG